MFNIFYFLIGYLVSPPAVLLITLMGWPYFAFIYKKNYIYLFFFDHTCIMSITMRKVQISSTALNDAGSVIWGHEPQSRWPKMAPNGSSVEFNDPVPLVRFSYIPDISFASVSFWVFSLRSFSVRRTNPPPSLLLSFPLPIFPAFENTERRASSDDTKVI